MSPQIHKFITLNRLALVVCMLVFIALRLVALDQQYLLHDERDLSLTGYAIAHTGKDFMGVQFPLNFPDTNPNSPPVPYYFNALWWLVGIPLSVFTVRLPYVLFTSLLIPALYDIVFQLTKKRSYAWCTTLVFISSPWIFHITRLGLDSPLALTLTLIAIALAIRRNTKTSLIFFFLAMNCYQAFRVIVPLLMLSMPFILESQVDTKKNVRKFLSWFIAVCIFSSIILLLNANTIFHRAGSELIFSDIGSYSEQVKSERLATGVTGLVSTVFTNKLTVILNNIGQRLISIYNPTFLFWTGDYTVTGSPFTGSFYIILLPFLLVGVIDSIRIEKNLLKICLIVILIGSVPAVIHKGDSAIALRGSLMTVGFAILITQGLIKYYSYLRLRYQLTRYLLIAIFILGLMGNIAFSAFTYYIRRPPQVADFFNGNEQILAKRLSKRHGESIDVFSHAPYDIFFAYQILNGGINFMHIPTISLLRPTPLQYEKISYASCDGHARSFINKSINIRVVERGCVDDLSAQLIESTINSDNIIYSSGNSGQPVYFIIPANIVIPLSES